MDHCLPPLGPALCIMEKTRFHVTWLKSTGYSSVGQHLAAGWSSVPAESTKLKIISALAVTLWREKLLSSPSALREKYIQCWLVLFVFVHTSKKKKKRLQVMGHKQHTSQAWQLGSSVSQQALKKQGFSVCFFVCFFFLLFRAVPTAYGVSQARSLIGATAAGLHHSHSDAGSKPSLRPTPQLTAMLDP